MSLPTRIFRAITDTATSWVDTLVPPPPRCRPKDSQATPKKSSAASAPAQRVVKKSRFRPYPTFKPPRRPSDAWSSSPTLDHEHNEAIMRKCLERKIPGMLPSILEPHNDSSSGDQPNNPNNSNFLPTILEDELEYEEDRPSGLDYAAMETDTWCEADEALAVTLLWRDLHSDIEDVVDKPDGWKGDLVMLDEKNSSKCLGAVIPNPQDNGLTVLAVARSPGRSRSEASPHWPYVGEVRTFLKTLDSIPEGQASPPSTELISDERAGVEYVRNVPDQDGVGNWIVPRRSSSPGKGFRSNFSPSPERAMAVVPLGGPTHFPGPGANLANDPNANGVPFAWDADYMTDGEPRKTKFKPVEARRPEANEVIPRLWTKAAPIAVCDGRGNSKETLSIALSPRRKVVAVAPAPWKVKGSKKPVQQVVEVDGDAHRWVLQTYSGVGEFDPHRHGVWVETPAARVGGRYQYLVESKVG